MDNAWVVVVVGPLLFPNKRPFIFFHWNEFVGAVALQLTLCRDDGRACNTYGDSGATSRFASNLARMTAASSFIISFMMAQLIIHFKEWR
jgi:hypothetical protein